MKANIETMRIKRLCGITVDMRRPDPEFGEAMDRLAADNGVEPIAAEGVFLVVIVGASGKLYDAAALGQASVNEARAMMGGDETSPKGC